MYGTTHQVSRSDEPGASINELRELLKLDDEYQDEDLLFSLLMSATDYASKYLARSIITTDWVRQIEPPKMSPGLSAGALRERPILLTYPPVVEITDVYTLNHKGERTSVKDYWLDIVPTPPELHIETQAWRYNLRIEYTAGYGDDYRSVPEAIQRGILLHAAHLFKFRGDDCSTEEAAVKSGAVGEYRIYRVERR